MVLKKKYNTVCMISIWMFTMFVGGCTIRYKIDTEPVADFSVPQRFNQSVRLNLSQELCSYVWEHKTPLGDKFQMDLGPALCSNAEAMTKSLFTQMIASRRINDSTTSKANAFLIPRIVSVERAMGATSFSDSKIIIDLEWMLKDADGNLIWVETIQGIGKAKTGNIFSHESEAKKQGKRAIKDLFEKSAEAILNSPEVKTFYHIK